MEFTQSISYPASADEVVAMYLAPAYLERRFGAFLVEGSARIRVEGQRITLDGECRPELIPAAAARFVASPLRVTFTEEWASDEARAVLQTGRRSWPPPGWRNTARLFAVRKK